MEITEEGSRFSQTSKFSSLCQDAQQQALVADFAVSLGSGSKEGSSQGPNRRSGYSMQISPEEPIALGYLVQYSRERAHWLRTRYRMKG